MVLPRLVGSWWLVLVCSSVWTSGCGDEQIGRARKGGEFGGQSAGAENNDNANDAAETSDTPNADDGL